ncbi:MAG: hypothetical protein OEY94_09800 [Alphaproteobacteria bacterium]|nr:hypothetical protein [Alphaproteobacteria bacterium]
MKRFYKLASVDQSGDAYMVMLDGKSIKTKSKKVLQHKSRDIAMLMMKEWAEQGDVIKPDTMPVTQIITTLIDHVEINREEITGNILKYLDTDLLCYHADEPEDLVKRQNDIWGRWISGFEKKYGISLKTTRGLSAVKQDQDLHRKVESDIRNLDLDRFNIVQIVTSLSGSLILALAFLDEVANAEDILECAYLEEHFKEELYDAQRYGRDPLLEKQQASKRNDLEACAEILSCFFIF